MSGVPNETVLKQPLTDETATLKGIILAVDNYVLANEKKGASQNWSIKLQQYLKDETPRAAPGPTSTAGGSTTSSTATPGSTTTPPNTPNLTNQIKNFKARVDKADKTMDAIILILNSKTGVVKPKLLTSLTTYQNDVADYYTGDLVKATTNFTNVSPADMKEIQDLLTRFLDKRALYQQAVRAYGGAP